MRINYWPKRIIIIAAAFLGVLAIFSALILWRYEAFKEPQPLPRQQRLSANERFDRYINTESQFLLALNNGDYVGVKNILISLGINPESAVCPVASPTPDSSPCDFSSPNYPGPDKPLCTPTPSPTPTPLSENCQQGEYCRVAHINCSELVGNITAYPAACEIHLPALYCDLYGIKYPPGGGWVEMNTNDLLNTRPDVGSYLQAKAVCFLAHEARHLKEGPGCKRCIAEKRTFSTETDCLKHYLEKNCSNNSWPKESCDGLRKHYFSQVAGYNINNCICSKTNSGKVDPDNKVCCDCENSCIKNGDLKKYLTQQEIKDLCQNLRRMYCVGQDL